MIELTDAQWHKSSYSGSGGECIEIASNLTHLTPVRDSKDPDGPALVFPTASFAAFLAGIKAGEFGTAR
jgi:hypothetical protein